MLNYSLLGAFNILVTSCSIVMCVLPKDVHAKQDTFNDCLYIFYVIDVRPTVSKRYSIKNVRGGDPHPTLKKRGQGSNFQGGSPPSHFLIE